MTYPTGYSFVNAIGKCFQFWLERLELIEISLNSSNSLFITIPKQNNYHSIITRSG